MACGTPMVSFKIGGVPDLVRPGITGYLASPEDPEDFRNGIIQLLENAHTIDSQQRNLCDRSSSSNLFKPSYLFSTSHPNPGLAIDILLGTFSINPT
jgi:glycosyltransferase involved in cell wall biosynthesis